MTPERFEEVERVCQATLDQPAESRQTFLDDACKGDADLRAEVESLLAGESKAESLLKEPPQVAATIRLAAGQRLGPYEILSLIGEGGMGQVYKARDTRLGRTVAIKVLPAGLAADPERRRRFEHEARAASALNHPHICTIHDIGSHAAADAGPVVDYLVMEHVEGQTLAERLRKGPLPLEQALSVAEQIADGLAAAHRQGIVHRDLKPGNVMLTKTGAARQGSPQAKLLDFGLAKLRRHGERPAVDLASASAPSESLTGRRDDRRHAPVHGPGAGGRQGGGRGGRISGRWARSSSRC